MALFFTFKILDTGGKLLDEVQAVDTIHALDQYARNRGSLDWESFGLPMDSIVVVRVPGSEHVEQMPVVF